MKAIFVLLSAGFFRVPGSVAEVETLYYKGSYEAAITTVHELLAQDSALGFADSLELYKYAAFSCVALDMMEGADSSFAAALALDSNLELDPELVSPKITQVFDGVKKRFRATLAGHDSSLVHNSIKIRELAGALNIRRAALSSFAFPGLGQLYSGQRGKGWIFIAGEGASLAGLLVTHIFTVKTHEAYSKAVSPNEIEECYRVYNNWYRARNVFGAAAIGIWISAPLEILLFPPERAKGR